MVLYTGMSVLWWLPLGGESKVTIVLPRVRVESGMS